MPQTSKEKTDTRKALLTAAALRDGILKDGKVSWSYAITMWIRGLAKMVWVTEEPSSAAQEDGAR